ncbi:MAG: hypothetical protein IKU23_00670 [Clostridia bacterium]|nr:hypothetical protein [Clostridia bacterium]
MKKEKRRFYGVFLSGWRQSSQPEQTARNEVIFEEKRVCHRSEKKKHRFCGVFLCF